MPTASAPLRASVLMLLAIASNAGDALAQGPTDSVAAQSRPRLRILPVIGSAPETGLQLGATALRIYRLGPDEKTRTSQQQAYVVYTAKSQARAFVQLDRWSLENRWRLRARAEYQHFPLPYFGIGADAPKTAEETYTASGPTLEFLLHRKVAPAWYIGSSVRFAETRISDLEPGGALTSGSVFGIDGGTVVQVQALVAHDSRDHVLAARRGLLAQVTTTVAGGALGSDYDFARHALELRRYWSPTSGATVIAAQFIVETTTGRPPFDQLAQVGSDVAMRGYTKGRFRDRHGMNAQVEYRSPYVRRFGMVAFGGAGVVAPSLSDLGAVDVLPTYGAGLRFLMVEAQRASVRIDYGRGRGSSGLYVSLNEAF